MPLISQSVIKVLTTFYNCKLIEAKLIHGNIHRQSTQSQCGDEKVCVNASMAHPAMITSKPLTKTNQSPSKRSYKIGKNVIFKKEGKLVFVSYKTIDPIQNKQLKLSTLYK